MTARELTTIKRSLGLTNKTFAAGLGVSLATMQRWCSGTVKISAIAEAAINAFNNSLPTEEDDQGMYYAGAGIKSVHRLCGEVESTEEEK